MLNTENNILSVSLFGNLLFYPLGLAVTLKKYRDELNMPIVIHCDERNLELFNTILEQEGISKDSLSFIKHKDSIDKQGMLWRFKPMGNKNTIFHTWDADSKLLPIRIEAINKFNKSERDFYTTWSARTHRFVMGGNSGFKKECLTEVYKQLSASETFKYGFDERVITQLLTKSDKYTGIIYSVKNDSNNLPNIPKIYIDDTIGEIDVYDIHEFTCLNNFEIRDFTYKIKGTKQFVKIK